MLKFMTNFNDDMTTVIILRYCGNRNFVRFLARRNSYFFFLKCSIDFKIHDKFCCDDFKLQRIVKYISNVS